MSVSQKFCDHKEEQRRDPSKMVNRGPDRRTANERREDVRESVWRVRSIKHWIKSIFKPRIGLDRRKGDDRRHRPRNADFYNPQSILTQEELNQLLGNDK
ncbi:hypothetical protein JCM30760_03870 [Thiomicrorhabdus hydrogeniphila]